MLALSLFLSPLLADLASLLGPDPRALTIAAQFALIIIATFVSEDLTCITVGLLIQHGSIDPFVGTAACIVGIFVGDCGLWLLGWTLGRRVLNWNFVARRVPAERIDEAGSWFDRNGWAAILAARFLPGWRLPVYLAAGVLGRRAGRFVIWAAIAALLWTPLLIGAAAWLGQSVVGTLHTALHSLEIALVIAAVTIWLAVRGAQVALRPEGRARFAARIAILWRWEFWPAWIFYLPLAPYLLWLMIRHRSATVFTAANPGIPHGGVVGESKFDILRELPHAAIAPSRRIDAHDSLEWRIDAVRRACDELSLALPVILKPDVGQRGLGLKLLRDWADLPDYLAQHPAAVLLQAYHPGPFEAGVFYYRLPGEAHGHILSITDKHFPIIVGDGESSCRALIWRHRRFRMQAATYLARLGRDADRVPAAGELVRLAVAGNHCQGTEFRDGAHLITPELERRIDEIAQAFDGFYFGRFDVRYSDVEQFKAGRDLTVIELNGVTSESTNLYDPSWSLWQAHAMLRRQWDILFRIGAANRERGHRVSSIGELIGVTRGHYRERRVSPLAD